jgi:hypothetical protein
MKKKVFLTVRYLSLSPSVSSHDKSDRLLYLSIARKFYGCGFRIGHILSAVSMVSGSKVGGMKCIHLDLYPHMTDLTNHYSFPYLANFMSAATGLAVVNPAAYRFSIYMLHSKHP